MAITHLSVPTTHQSLFFQRPYVRFHVSPTLSRFPSKSIISLSSSSSPVVEDGPFPPSSDPLPFQSNSATIDADELPIGGCKACGRQEIEKGCNGEGRIQGGIATVPGFGWWPIKAYRPCPGFVASGGRYRRQGQSMDDVVSGRGKPGIPGDNSTEVESSKKGRGPRSFKR